MHHGQPNLNKKPAVHALQKCALNDHDFMIVVAVGDATSCLTRINFYPDVHESSRRVNMPKKFFVNKR